MNVKGGVEEKPQGRLSLFVFPLPSAEQTVTRMTEVRAREGRREVKMENNRALTCPQMSLPNRT